MSESLDNSPQISAEAKPRGLVSSFIREHVYSLPRKVLAVLFLVGVMSLTGYVLVTNDGLYRSSGLKSRKADLELENLRLEEENRQLLARIERFGHDPVFLEDEARRKLRLVRPGEVIYRLAEEPDLSDGEATGQLR
ncbi:MAG: septum formation initiator family protein [Deltaproteobacteria bacterium]|jgi:cell division protein FtsB|nr:septum formation initiator family protein [Deltaproteobacteria bacterium]